MHKFLNSITVKYIEMTALQLEWVNLYFTQQIFQKCKLKVDFMKVSSEKIALDWVEEFI